MAEDVSGLTGELYRQWERSMAEWWDKVLESPAFMSGMGDTLAWQAKSRGQWEDHVDGTMEQLHLPSRKDIVRLARIATLLEDRILSMEDSLLEIGDQLNRIEAETLRARVDAAEALVTVQERLASIEARLEAKPAAKAPARRRSPRKPKAE